MRYIVINYPNSLGREICGELDFIEELLVKIRTLFLEN